MLLSYHDSVDAVSREGNGDACVTLFRGIHTLKSESREPTFSDDNNLDTDHGDCGGGQRADGRAVLCLLLLGDGRLGANAGVGGNEGHAADQPDDLESCISERFLWNGSGLFARHDHLRMAAATRVRLGDHGCVRVSVWRFHGDCSFQRPTQQCPRQIASRRTGEPRRMDPLPEALDAMESSSHRSVHLGVRAPYDWASVAACEQQVWKSAEIK